MFKINDPKYSCINKYRFDDMECYFDFDDLCRIFVK